MLKWLRRNQISVSVSAVAVILICVVTNFYSVDREANGKIVDYITSVGWRIDENPLEIAPINIPKEFDMVFRSYNQIQQESGFNLEPYRGLRATRYSYRVLNHVQSKSEEIRANVIVWQDEIIAADICSTSMNGFMHKITDTADIAFVLDESAEAELTASLPHGLVD